MRILVTGATGFVGTTLVPHLVKEGHQVTAWVRDPEKAARALGQGPALVTGPLILDGQEAVIHLAGENVMGARWSPARKAALVESRVGLTRRVVEALGRANPRPQVLVSASAVGFYGDAGDRVVSEADPPATDFLATLCRDWEAAALEARSLGVRVALPRIGVVLGPGGGALSRLLPLARFGLSGRLGPGTQLLPWIHLEDLARILAFAATNPAVEGPFHATAPQPVPQAVFARALARSVGRPVGPPVPALAMRAALGESASVLLWGQDARPGRLLDWGFRFRRGSLEEGLAP